MRGPALCMEGPNLAVQGRLEVGLGHHVLGPNIILSKFVIRPHRPKRCALAQVLSHRSLVREIPALILKIDEALGEELLSPSPVELLEGRRPPKAHVLRDVRRTMRARARDTKVDLGCALRTSAGLSTTLPECFSLERRWRDFLGAFR